MSIEWVSSQIAEILDSGEKNPALLHKKIVVSPFGPVFISRSSCLGRFWTFIWGLSRIIDWWGGFETKAFERALAKTASVWEENISLLSFHSNIFKTLMEYTLKGKAYLSPEEIALTHKILRLAQIYLFPAFHNYGPYPFVENWGHINRILEVSKHTGLGPSCLEEGFLSWISTLSGDSFPSMSTFKKIFFEEALSPEERGLFKSWIDTIQEQEAFIPIADFLLALKRLAFHLGAVRQLPTVLISLSQALKKKGCSLFDKIDPYHLDRVTTSINTFKLEYEMSKPSISLSEEPRRLSLKSENLVQGVNPFCSEQLLYLPLSDASQLVWSPRNRVALALIQAERSSGAWKNYLLPLEILEDGFYAKIPKWGPLFEHNLPALALLLESLLSKQMWSPLLVKDLLVSVGTDIKILSPVPLEKTPLVYDKVVSFLASFENPDFFIAMVQRLNLDKHPVHLYYKDILRGLGHPKLDSHAKLAT